MFPELHNFGKELSLVMNSGVQFIDFALTINWKAKEWREKAMAISFPRQSMGRCVV